jgi:hypothetical protein
MLFIVGASMLAMVCNENAGLLTPSGVLESIASMLAPAGVTEQHYRRSGFF